MRDQIMRLLDIHMGCFWFLAAPVGILGGVVTVHGANAFSVKT